MLFFQMQQFRLCIGHHYSTFEFIEHGTVVSAVAGNNNILYIKLLKVYYKADGIALPSGSGNNVQISSTRPDYLAQPVAVIFCPCADLFYRRLRVRRGIEIAAYL